MSSCRDETIKGFNAYIEELQKQKLSGMRFTLTQFDSIGVDVVHDAVPLSEVDRLTEESYVPRASTPLYDAIGKTIRAAEEKSGSKYKVLFVTLTDGLENASSEWNQASINRLMTEKEKNDHWSFAHIGVGANGWGGVMSVSPHGTARASNQLHIDPKDIVRSYKRAAGMTVNYCCSLDNVSASAQNLWEGTSTTDEDKS